MHTKGKAFAKRKGNFRRAEHNKCEILRKKWVPITKNVLRGTQKMDKRDKSDLGPLLWLTNLNQEQNSDSEKCM